MALDDEDLMVFSVLICSLGAASLARSIKSVFADHYSHLEVVLVIDNPNFDPKPILEDCLSASEFLRVVIINNSKNVGLTRSLNIGLAQCKGKYLCRLDDDDYFIPGRLQKVQVFFENNPDVAIVTGGAKVQMAIGESYCLSVPQSHKKIEKSLLRRNILVHSALHVRLDLFKQLGGYNEDFYYAQDYEMYLRLLRAGVKFAGLQTLLVYRQEGQSSITVKKHRHQALYSLAAISLHHARTWESENKIVKAIVVAFIRFYAPKVVRTIVRKFRSLKRNVSL